MKTILIAGALAASVLCAGCANQGASMNSAGVADAPNVTVRDDKRHEIMVGSRIARETRESAESVKTVSRRAYEENKIAKPGSPIDGGG